MYSGGLWGGLGGRPLLENRVDVPPLENRGDGPPTWKTKGTDPPLENRGTSPLENRGTTPLENRGTSPLENRGDVFPWKTEGTFPSWMEICRNNPPLKKCQVN